MAKYEENISLIEENFDLFRSSPGRVIISLGMKLRSSVQSPIPSRASLRSQILKRETLNEGEILEQKNRKIIQGK